jgi:hypothetical protein
MSEELHTGLHPDPDALNAFIEGVLPEHERSGCLAHLAECAQCREVVFLAGQAAEIEQPVVAGKAPFWRKLFRPMPVLAVACAAIIGVVSFELFRMIQSAERRPQVIASAKLPASATKADEEKQEPQLALRKVSPQPARREREQPPSAAVAPPAAPPQAVAGVDAIQALPAAPPPIVTAPPVTAFAPAPPPREGAGVVGTITDPAGAVIPNAQVELKNEGTGATYSSTSDTQGQFRIAGLAPGRYDFSATSMGFKKFVRPGVNVEPQEIARLDSRLDVGATSETVIVNAEAPLLKTESGEVSHQVGQTPDSELPLLTSTRANARAMNNASPAYRLPDQSTPVSAAAKDKLVVAADAKGSLFFSDNQGKSWKHIKGKWKGKAVRLVLSANAAFELTTDAASTWVSTDGRHWSAAPASR